MICAPIEAGRATAPDPEIVFEILSPSNERDTRDNVWAYSTIPSVREIVIFHLTRVLAEIFRRAADGNWPGEPEILLPGDTLRIENIDLTCSLAEVYEGTHLA